ncbi:MAG: bifunctional helix-turn-helix domain-containing protein/methylated-DNA--[protein]-cysteine S-methyltransferase [Anaerolineales bacterium]|nr:bifunctional helix-turn-helix domain-containing protein/methylated-DNA--[protein]-cysteine S-methyltransferase [Anaerolineales bacterium]
MNTTIANYQRACEDYQRIEQTILYLDQNKHKQPSLKEIASGVHLSEYHFQRLFSRWVGISPKRFLQFLTKENAKQLLKAYSSLEDVTYEVGLSSPGRLHDLFINCEAVTPGEYKNNGKGLTILYGFHPTPFGECLLAVTDRGICKMAFIQNNNRAGMLQTLQEEWDQAKLLEDQPRTSSLVHKIFSIYQEERPRLFLFLRGTNFQIKVWEALLSIPLGHVTTYQDIAFAIGNPKAVRAVANAVAHNPLPVIIPCHRVIRSIGVFGEYAYGTARKRAILGWEMAKLSEQEVKNQD